jgi:hypothetical protein
MHSARRTAIDRDWCHVSNDYLSAMQALLIAKAYTDTNL